MSCFLQHWELKMSYEENKLVLMAHASRLYRMVATMKFTLCFYQGVVGFFALLRESGISVSAKGLRWQRMTRSDHLASMIQVLLEQEIRISTYTPNSLLFSTAVCFLRYQLFSHSMDCSWKLKVEKAYLFSKKKLVQQITQSLTAQ